MQHFLWLELFREDHFIQVFSNFEFNQKHEDYQSCIAKIEAEDGRVYDCDAFGFPHQIRVFNTDFIKNNLKWDTVIEPILMIGEENIKLQNKLESLRVEKDEKQQKIKDLFDKRKKVDSSLNEKISSKARELKNTLSVPDYTRRNLDQVIAQVGEKVTILDDGALKNNIDIYRSTDKKPEIN